MSELKVFYKRHGGRFSTVYFVQDGAIYWLGDRGTLFRSADECFVEGVLNDIKVTVLE